MRRWCIYFLRLTHLVTTFYVISIFFVQRWFNVWFFYLPPQWEEKKVLISLRTEFNGSL